MTVLTLGIYRFWMKTRLRRWYWSGVRVGGYPLEYFGDPLEKLLGFLIAVAFLAFYIGIVNLVLMFASFSLVQSNWAAYATSFAGLVPLWFYAQYRARRYVVGRTAWRGIRFSLDPGAWGYAWRALVHWAITIVTLGLLWPRMTFWLEKYKTDRTSWGDHRLTQGGRWTMLIRPALILYVGALSTAALTAWLFWLNPTLAAIGQIGPDVPDDPELLRGGVNWVGQFLLYIPLGLLMGYGALHYRVRSRGILASHKTADGLSLKSQPEPTWVLGIYVLGALLMGLCLIVPLVLFVMFLGGVLATGGPEVLIAMGKLPDWLLLIAGGLVYFSFFLFWSTLNHVLIAMPIWAHYAQTTTLYADEEFAAVHQGRHDRFDEAEGFAEALDVGAAI
ncbi:DUF898 domain-containing protein [Mesobacterium pallidum]|uniref:DUF898 domain-containing protein n=1 Tax=Mesobacterium pallidum TaxID=2872037 RepID=UPI001EE28C55